MRQPQPDRLIRMESYLHSRSLYLMAKDQFNAREPLRQPLFEPTYWHGPRIYQDHPDAA